MESRSGGLRPVGAWSPEGDGFAAFDPADIGAVIAKPRLGLHIVRDGEAGRIGVALGGRVGPGGAFPLLATLPPLYPEWLGDRSFGEVHGVRFPYVAGEMANGIASASMVVALAEAGMLGFYGAAGLSFDRVSQEVGDLARRLGRTCAWGVNIIHSPQEPALEDRLADLLIGLDVPCISVSAFMGLTPAVIRCAAAGLRQDAEGTIVRQRQIFAKVSRPEVAEHFMSPPPTAALAGLVAQGLITPVEAELAARLPIAEDVTIEADSGGHTDNRPLMVIFPAMLELRARLVRRYRFLPPIRLGAAGGIGTPVAVAGAFALGADYVVTGSINQAAVEAGQSPAVKALLATADIADVAMAPAADMFELGIKVQVLKRGTLFAARATRLYEVFTRYAELEAIPEDVRTRLETEIFRQPLAEAWAETRAYWQARNPGEVARAEREPKHRMALTFRAYLGRSSHWAISGTVDRSADYQVWCGPAMGAFNGWAQGSFLADPGQRSVVQIARNLLEGAAVVARAQQLRSHGIAVPSGAFHFTARPLD